MHIGTHHLVVLTLAAWGLVSQGLIKRGFMMASVMVLVACAPASVPLSDHDRLVRLQNDMEQIFSAQEPIDGPVSLSEAIARALKYNLDARVKQMEKVLSQGNLTVAQFDLLPELTAEAGYTTRNPETASRSRSVLTGRQSLEPSTSQDKQIRTADFSLSWNLLDFGMAYARTQQAGNEIRIAEEKRRKAVHNIVLDVRDAYWKAVSAQKNLQAVRDAINEIYASMNRAQTINVARLGEPRKLLNHQRQLLDNLQILTDIRRELELAPLSLAALMNVRPGKDFRVVEEGGTHYPRIDIPLPLLEKTALLDRPEVREEDYKARMSEWEVKKVMWSLLPGIGIEGGGNYTSNSFASYGSWWSASFSLTKNILEVFTFPWRHEVAKDQVRLAGTRRLAMSMGVIAQVHIAYKHYTVAEEIYLLSQQITDVSERLRTLTRSELAAQTSDQLELVRDEMEYILSSLRQDLAYAELQNAYSRVLNSIGLDLVPDQVESLDIQTLSANIREELDTWQNITLSHIDETVAALPTP